MSLSWSPTDFTSPFSVTTRPAKGVSTVITMTNISGIQGTHMCEPVATVRYERAWKQRPRVVVLGAFVNLGAARPITAQVCPQ